MGFTLGIDIGSTSIKAVVYDADQDVVVASSAQALPAPTTEAAGHYELNPTAVETVIDSTLARLKITNPLEVSLVERIGFTGQMHGGMAVDTALTPLTNYITWQDKRADRIDPTTGTSFVHGLRLQVASSEWDAVGSRPYTGFLAATINASHELQTTLGTWCSIYDWIAAKLIGGRVVTDITTAAAWGLFRITDLQWSPSAIEAARIEGKLPEVVEPGSEIGNVSVNYAARLGLSRDAIVCAGIGDTQASYLGSTCGESEVLLNFGTGSQSMWESRAFAQYPQTDTRYFLAGRYLHVVPTLAGGRAYQALCDFYRDVVLSLTGISLKRNEVYAMMNDFAQASTDGLGFSTLFNGSRYLGETKRASLTGIDLNNLNAGSVTSALLAGMVEEVVGPFERATVGRLLVGAVGSGNGMRRNPALQAVAEARLGSRLRLSPHLEEAATGAAMLAARAVKS